MKAYKLSDAANPPKTKFIKYEPKSGDKIALNTQPRDMQFWELVNSYVQREPMADRDRFFYAWLKDLGIEKGKPFKPTDYQKEILQAGWTWVWPCRRRYPSTNAGNVPDFSLREKLRPGKMRWLE